MQDRQDGQEYGYLELDLDLEVASNTDNTNTNSVPPNIGNGYNYGYGFYSWACYNHAVGSSPLFWATGTNRGISQKVAFETYLDDLYGTGNASSSSASVISYVDTCFGFNCGLHCDGL